MALVGTGTLAGAGEALGGFTRRGPVLVVTDENVASHWLEPLLASLEEEGFAPETVILAPGEATKTLDTVRGLYDRLLDLGADRGTPVVGLGGGVVTDIAGFAAATFLRGLPWMAVPTSLLGMVDAAIGGKTGVNLPAGKNLVGAFHLPGVVLADVDTLSTLPGRHLRNGTAEVVKTGLALSSDLYETVLAEPGAYLAVVTGSAAEKERIVELDERERGRRRVLNFGHTAGHAIEAATGFGPVLHGEAVAVGMVAAARVSVARGILDPATEGEIATALRTLGLPASVNDLPVRPDSAEVERHLAVDKKRKNGRLALVLLSRIGEAKIIEDGTAAEVLRAIPGL